MSVNRVVYFLGAGFSAPLGLPVVSNFVFKAKDLVASDPEKHRLLARVIDRVNRLAHVKSYFDADLFNIEEVLSILEMADGRGTPSEKEFTGFLADTIVGHTPAFSKASGPDPDLDVILDRGTWWCGYTSFVLSLCGVTLERADDGRTLRVAHSDARRIRYDVITMNYDDVLERAVGRLVEGGLCGPRMRLADAGEGGGDDGPPELVKLHGCVRRGSIVPPTWNKASTPALRGAWRRAIDLLAAANEIRILGYSLPVADAYVRYLFKAAALRSGNLKRLDVLTLDADGQTERRFRDLVRFPGFRFQSGKLEVYLGDVEQSVTGRSDGPVDAIETAHRNVFRGA